MIPKVFHYCWFGPKKIGKIEADCIASWQEIHPDFEIKKWDETNCDMDIPFVKEAYRNKKWAFVADYFRFRILEKVGGIYMDTDMLLLKRLDHLLNFKGFIGFEDNIHVSAGIIGSERRNSVIKDLNQYYKSLKFNTESPLVINSSLNFIFEKLGLVNYNVEQEIGGFKMFASNVFYPLTFEDSKKGVEYHSEIQQESLAVHLWNHSWGDEFSEFGKGNTVKGIGKAFSKILKNPMLPKLYYKKLVKNIIYSIKK
mgnify:CR=1 FL=1